MFNRREISKSLITASASLGLGAFNNSFAANKTHPPRVISKTTRRVIFFLQIFFIENVEQTN